MPNLPPDDARRIGAELGRWSRRSTSDANARAFGLFGVLIVLALVAAQNAPQPAATVRGLATVYFAMLAAAHFVSLERNEIRWNRVRGST